VHYPDGQPLRIRKGIIALLEIKDSDIRLLSLRQCRHAVDKSIHIGGAFSATIPMVSLFYGGLIDLRIEHPTAVGQDIFVLSKGHAVATLASIYADLGYFGMDVLDHSRSLESILNGHPGPLLPGVHVATGPMGQGVGVAQGFAIAGRKAPEFDVYAITGDGELQEGPVWEAVMFAGSQRLENLCVMVDHNGGQLDNAAQLHYPFHDLASSFSSFGWRVLEVDATHVHVVSPYSHASPKGRQREPASGCSAGQRSSQVPSALTSASTLLQYAASSSSEARRHTLSSVSQKK
jgi:transketolase